MSEIRTSLQNGNNRQVTSTFVPKFLVEEGPSFVIGRPIAFSKTRTPTPGTLPVLERRYLFWGLGQMSNFPLNNERGLVTVYTYVPQTDHSGMRQIALNIPRLPLRCNRRRDRRAATATATAVPFLSLAVRVSVCQLPIKNGPPTKGRAPSECGRHISRLVVTCNFVRTICRRYNSSIPHCVAARQPRLGRL